MSDTSEESSVSEEQKSEGESSEISSKENSDRADAETSEGSSNPSKSSNKSISTRGPPPPVPRKPPRAVILAKGNKSGADSQSSNSSSENNGEENEISTANSSSKSAHSTSAHAHEANGERDLVKYEKSESSVYENASHGSPLKSVSCHEQKEETRHETSEKKSAETTEKEKHVVSSNGTPEEICTSLKMKNVEIYISDYEQSALEKEGDDDGDLIPLIIDDLPMLRIENERHRNNAGNGEILIEDGNDETSRITGCSWELDDEDGTDCSSSCSMEQDENLNAKAVTTKRKIRVGCGTATTCVDSQIKDQIVVVKLAAKVVHCPSLPSSFSASPRPPPPPPPIPNYPESSDASSASNPSERDAAHGSKSKARSSQLPLTEEDDPGKDGNEPGAEETSTSELYQNMVVAHGLMIEKEMDDIEIMVQKVDRQRMENGSNYFNKTQVSLNALVPRPLTEGKCVDDLTEDEDQIDGDDDHCYQNIVVKKGKFAVATKKSNMKSSCDPSVQSVPLVEKGFSTRIMELQSPTSEASVPVVHAVINLPPRKASLIKERRRSRMENLSYQKASRINQMMVAEFKAAGTDRPSSVSVRDGKVMSVTSNNCSELPNSDGTAGEPGSIIGKVKIGFNGFNKAKSSLQKSKSVVSNHVERAGKSMSSMKKKVGSWYHKRVKTPVEQLGAELGLGSSNNSQAGESRLDTASVDPSCSGGRCSNLRNLRSLTSTPADFLDLHDQQAQDDEVDGPAYSNMIFDRKSVDYSLDSSINAVEEPLEKADAGVSEDEDSFKTKGQNEFEELRRVVKQGGDFCKDLAAVLQERSELEAQYAKGLSKLSAKLLKASKEATGSVAHAWQAVAVQIDTQAELHRQWSTALAEEVARPLRSSLETQHKIRKSVEVLVEKTTRNLAEWRTAESKAKRQCFSSSKEFEKLQESSAVIVNNNLNSTNSTSSNSANSSANSNSNANNLGGSNLALAEVRTRSRLLSVPPLEKDPIKLEAKRRKAEEAVRRADIEYYTFCVRSERARLEWESAIRNGSTCLRTLEEEKLSLLRDLAIKYYQYLNELAPRQVQSVESLEEPVKNCSVGQDMHAIVDIRRHAGAEQLLPDFYAEDTSNLMKRERRQEALQKFLYLVNQDLEREKKGAAGIETLAKAIAEAPKIDNAHHDISDKLYYVKSMLLYLEGTRCKVDNSLADIEGRQRANNPITQYMRHQRDKQGFPQTILKVPSWAKDDCLAICTGTASAGSTSPDWNDRGNADGTSGQHETDFDEFSSQDSGCDHNTDSCGEESNKAASNLISAPSIGRCRAIYDYDANLFDELTIRTGDVINIHDKQEDGWWLGELNGIIGIFPATYVEEISATESNSGD